MIKSGICLFAIVLLYGVVGEMDQRAEERQAAHVAQRNVVVAQRQAELEKEAFWASLQLRADEVWPAKIARK